MVPHACFISTFHVQDFFKKHGVAVMTIRELFDFIVDPTISDENVDSYLEEVCNLLTSGSSTFKLN